MTQPTHFFLGLLSSFFNVPRTTCQTIEDSGPRTDGRVKSLSLTNPIPPATPEMQGGSVYIGNTGLGFRYGAACNPRW